MLLMKKMLFHMLIQQKVFFFSMRHKFMVKRIFVILNLLIIIIQFRLTGDDYKV